MLTAGISLHSQTYPNGLHADSVDPVADSIYVSQMRHRMDEIHRTQHRPTVALVLSGGGAKGAAHIGVLRMLEELEIPVDMICGTSMGGLMGAMYSLGYSTEYIDSTIRNMDWGVALTDRIDQRYIPYQTKRDKATYIMNVPFHYAEEDFSHRIMEQEKYGSNDGVLRVGANQDSANEAQYGSNSLFNSLPAGYVYGFNVNNLISSLTVGYQDSISFRDLPIPFFCVASDVVSCKAKNWGSGSLKNALRSTMSIPALFNPVRTHGMVLVDGGTRNNFPVDLARAMGADLVIGVDLSDLNPSYSQINNIGSILSQFITMLGQDTFEKNVQDVDVFIKPDLHEYNMLSFDAEAIETMIGRGYEAARSKKDQLREIKSFVGDARTKLNNRPATDINHEAVQLSAVLFNGLSDAESRVLQRRIKMNAGEFVTNDDIVVAMSKIQATGAFESVTYSLLGSESPYRLVFNCSKAPTHSMRMGFRADSEELVGMLFNVGFNTHKLMGSKLELTGKVASNSFADVRYALDIPSLPTINVDAKLSSVNARLLEKNDTPGMRQDSYITASYVGHRERVYFSNIKWTKVDLQLGVQNRCFKVPEGSDFARELATRIGSDSDYNPLRGDYFGGFVSGVIYTMDNQHYPSRGMKMNLDYNLDLLKFVGGGGFTPVQKAAFDLKFVIPFGSRVALIPDLHLRSTLNRNQYSLAHANFIGGSIADRYMDGQVPFVCMNNVYSAADQLVLLNLDFRVRFFDNFYASMQGGYMRDSGKILDLVSGLRPSIWGAAMEVAYNSIIGPVKMNVHWSSLNKSLGYYFSIGYDF